MQISPRSARLACLVFALGATSAYAETLTVGPNVTEFDFTLIQAAIDASSPGDVIRVSPGTYSSFRLDKAVSVLGSGASQSLLIRQEGTSLFGTPTWEPVIEISALPGGSARVGGFGVRSAVNQDLPSNSWVLVEQCSGSVELFDLELELPAPEYLNAIFPLPQGAVELRDSTQVVLAGVRVGELAQAPLEGQGPSDPLVLSGSPGLQVTDSSVWISDCILRGSALPECQGAEVISFGHFPGAGMRLNGACSVIASGSTFLGAPGRASGAFCSSAVGGAGIEVPSGDHQVSLTLHGGRPNLIQGGAAETGPAPGFGIQALAGQVDVHTDAKVLISGGPEALAGSFAADFDPAGNQVLTVSDVVRPALNASRYVVPLGNTFVLNFGGEPNTLHIARFTETMISAAILPGIEGPALIAPGGSETLALVGVDATGQGSRTLTVPADVQLLDLSVVIQSLSFHADQARIAPPVMITTRP